MKHPAYKSFVESLRLELSLAIATLSANSHCARYCFQHVSSTTFLGASLPVHLLN